MNRAQMTAPFAEEELRQFKGRGGKTMTYIEDETVMDRLDAGYGFGNWQLLVDNVPTDPGVVKVRLGVRENGEWTWYEDYGYPNQPDGDVLKEAVSDGIRRCGRYVGIARDLYRKTTYEPGGALGPPAPSERNPRVGAPDYEDPAAADYIRHEPDPEAPGDGSLIGTAAVGKPPSDFELRASPNGQVLSFRLSAGRKSIKVVAYDRLAEAISLVKADIIDQRVQCWGVVSDESFTPKGATKEVVYQVLTLHRIQTPTATLGDNPEAESLPMFDPDQAELDKAAEAA